MGFKFNGTEWTGTDIITTNEFLWSYTAPVPLKNDMDARPIIPSACINCSNHPSNGGSGICHCILGSPVVTC